jgi:WD40 repeat protein
VQCLALSAEEGLVLAGTELGKVCLRALPSGDLVHQFPDHGDRVTGVAFAGPDLIVSSSRDGTIRLWRRDGTPLLTLEMPGPVQRLAVSADGSRLAAVIEGERAARLWHLDRLGQALDRLGLPLGVEYSHPDPARPIPPVAVPAYQVEPATGPNGLKAEYFASHDFHLKVAERYDDFRPVCAGL